MSGVEKRSLGKALAVLAVVVVAATCCGCGGLVMWGPGWVQGLFLEEEPMDVPSVPANRGIYVELEERFTAGGPVIITGQELSQLVDPQASLDVEEFYVKAQGDAARLDVSLYVHEAGGQFLNVHLVGEAEVEQGWFTHFQVDELVVSGRDLGQYVAGQELASQVNQGLANQRAQHPEIASLMDEIEHATVEGGRFVITLKEGGYERLEAIEVE